MLSGVPYCKPVSCTKKRHSLCWTVISLAFGGFVSSRTPFVCNRFVVPPLVVSPTVARKYASTPPSNRFASLSELRAMSGGRKPRCPRSLRSRTNSSIVVGVGALYPRPENDVLGSERGVDLSDALDGVLGAVSEQQRLLLARELCYVTRASTCKCHPAGSTVTNSFHKSRSPIFRKLCNSQIYETRPLPVLVDVGISMSIPSSTGVRHRPRLLASVPCGGTAVFAQQWSPCQKEETRRKSTPRFVALRHQDIFVRMLQSFCFTAPPSSSSLF